MRYASLANKLVIHIVTFDTHHNATFDTNAFSSLS